MGKIGLLVLLTCVTSSIWASVIPTQNEIDSRTILLANKAINNEDSKTSEEISRIAPDSISLGKPDSLVHQKQSTVLNSPIIKDGESHPNEEASKTISVLIPTQLNLSVKNTTVHTEVDVVNKDYQKSPEKDSIESENPLLRSKSGTRARNPSSKPPKPTEGSTHVIDKPSNHARPHRLQNKFPGKSQQPDLKNSSSGPKPSALPNRDKPSKPNVSNTTGNSGSVQKPDKPSASNAHHKPQRNSSNAKSESKETLHPEPLKNVAKLGKNGNSNTVQNKITVPHSQNSVKPTKNDETNAEKATMENISLETTGKDFSSQPMMPIPSLNASSNPKIDVTANIDVNNKDSKLNPKTVVSAADKSLPSSKADQIQNQIKAQIELIHSQINDQQQQQTHIHPNTPQSAGATVTLAEPPKIPSLSTAAEETSMAESEKIIKKPETKDFHKQIVSEGQYVFQLQNITHTSTQSIVTTNSLPSKFVENTVKLEIMTPLNSQYLNSEDKTQAIIESLALKVPPSPVKDISSCKDKGSSTTDNKDTAKPSKVVPAIIGAEKKPEELVYEVEEISVEVPALVQNPEIASPANEMPVNQDMPQLPSNVVELIYQLYALTNQSTQGTNQPHVLQAADQNNAGITTVASDNQTLAQLLIALITAMTINNINQQNNGLTISGIQNTPSANAASVASVNSVVSSPYVGVQGSYVPINYVVTAYPQLMPYLAPYVVINGYPQGITSPAANVSSVIGTIDYTGALSPSSSQILTPNSDTFVEEESQGASTAPMNEEMNNEKYNEQLQKYHQNYINAYQMIYNKEKPAKPNVNNNPSKPSSVLGKPQNSTNGSQNPSFGPEPGNSLQHVSVLGSNSNSQNSQNSNNIDNKPQLSLSANQNSFSNGDKPHHQGNSNYPGNRPQQFGNENSLHTIDKPQQSGSTNYLNTGDKPQQSGNTYTLNTANKPQQLGNVNTINTANIPQQLGNVNTFNTANIPQQLGNVNTLNIAHLPQQLGNVNTLNTATKPQNLGNVNTINTGNNSQQLGNLNTLSTGDKPGQSGDADSFSTDNKHEQGPSRPLYAGKPTVTTSNNTPQGSSLTNNKPQSASANSVSKPQGVAVSGLDQPSSSVEANEPLEFQQPSNNNPNAFVLSTMGQFLEHELQQHSEGSKLEVTDSSKPVSHPVIHLHANHGHGVHPQPLSGGNKPRPGGHGYLIPPKSADNGVDENIQANHQIVEGLHKTPATAAGDSKNSETTSVDSKNPGASAGDSTNLGTSAGDLKNPIGGASSSPTKPGTSTGAKRPNKVSKPVSNSVSKPAASPSKPNKPQFGFKRPANKQKGPSQEVIANSTLSIDKPKPAGWQLPKWPSFSKFYHNIFGTRQRAAETEDEVSENETNADNCTPGLVGLRNKQDNRPLCGVDLPKEAYTCETLCRDGGFNVGTCHNDDSCVCSYSEASEIGLTMEFYYDRNMTSSWEDYYPTYESCSRCACSNQCTQTGYFMGICGNTCYCGRPFENGAPLDLYKNEEQIYE